MMCIIILKRRVKVINFKLSNIAQLEMQVHVQLLCVLGLVGYASSLRMMMSLGEVHKSLFGKVDTQLKLKLTPYASERNVWTEGAFSGTCEWYEEKMGGKLTGVSKNTLKGPNFESVTLNCWMGPAYSVPHMLLKLTQAGSDVSLSADYVVRGSTPIGTDQTVIDNFYGKEVNDWYDKAASNGVLLPPPSSFSGRLLQSPIALNVGKLSLETATATASEHVERWLQWIADKEGKGKQVEARSRGAFNGRDDKLRQYAYRAVVSEMTLLLGSAGASIGAAANGPIAEAYVGGGS